MEKKITEVEKILFSILEELNITYQRYAHPPVFTVDEASRYWQDLPGVHCKNLFLRNKKGSRHYLVILEQQKKAAIKDLAHFLGEDRLSFASAERLQRYLGLTPGAVSPFGLINDREQEVRVVIDVELKQAAQIYFHPNVNTASIGLDFNDFQRFLDHCGQRIRYISL